MRLIRKRMITLFLAALLLLQTGIEPYGAVLKVSYGATGQEPGEGQDPSEGQEPGEGQDPNEGQDPEEVYYTITFDLAGGYTSDGLAVAYQKVAEGELPDAAAVVEPIRTGYLFQGWLDAEGAFYTFDQPVTEDFTLKAAWLPITYRVHFEPGGGVGEMPDQSFTYGEEKQLIANLFTKDNYAFAGWKINGVVVYKNGAAVKNLASQEGAVVTLEAAWAQGKYNIRYNANGGSGTLKDQLCTCGKTRTLRKNKFERPGYTFVEWNTKKDGTGTSYKEKQKVKSLTKVAGSVVTLYAIWKGNPYQVSYNGNGANSGSVAGSSHVYGVKSTLRKNNFHRKGYTFVGWNTQKDGKGKTFQSGAEISNGLVVTPGQKVTLYAKWSAVKYTITYQTKGGKMGKSYKKTYTIATETFTLPRPTRSGYDFDGWYLKSNYKSRIGEIKKGRTGNVKLYAKWVKCSGKVKKDAAKLSTCKATGKGKVKVQASIKKRVASSDDYYYLVYLNPMSKKIYKMAERCYKKKKITFSLKTSKNQGYAVSMFGIAVKKKGKYHLISKPSFVGSVEKAAGNKMGYKPGKTKKGIQFTESMDEIYACDAKQNFLNLTVSMVCTDGKVPYKYNGKTYYFNSLDYYQQVVKDCNKRGISVTMQILLDWTWGQTDLIASPARIYKAAPFYSWNLSSNAAREKMEALFCYVGKVFGKKKCYVSNWILGNEINNPKAWNYAGGMSESKYFKSYAHAFRTLYYAVRSQYSNAHIFICMDNCWNIAVPGGYSTKRSIQKVAKYLKDINKGIKWNLAYHAYSYPLTYTKVWEGFGITNKASTPSITMKNLKVLTSFIKKNYGSSVRIILSEQGYSSSWGQPAQAAALAYSYYIAACNPMVDAFIIRSYRDNPEEASQGLSMGIEGKEAFMVFKKMDTSSSFRYTNRYLGLIGAKKWSKLIPNFSKTRMWKMYRKT